MSKINKKKANLIRTKLILIIAKEQEELKLKYKKNKLMMINGKSSLEIDEQYSTNSFEITIHQIINGGKNLCVSSSSKIKPRQSLSLKTPKKKIRSSEGNNSTNFKATKDIDSIKLQSKKKISEEKLKLKSKKELSKKIINWEKEKMKELQKKCIRLLRNMAQNYKNYLLLEKQNKFKRQKTVSIQSPILENKNIKNNNNNFHKNSISSKGIVKVSKQSFFAKTAFQRKKDKKKTENPKARFETNFIDFHDNDSDKETNFQSVKQEKKQFSDDEDYIFSSCNNEN